MTDVQQPNVRQPDPLMKLYSSFVGVMGDKLISAACGILAYLLAGNIFLLVFSLYASLEPDYYLSHNWYFASIIVFSALLWWGGLSLLPRLTWAIMLILCGMAFLIVGLADRTERLPVDAQRDALTKFIGLLIAFEAAVILVIQGLKRAIALRKT